VDLGGHGAQHEGVLGELCNPIIHPLPGRSIEGIEGAVQNHDVAGACGHGVQAAGQGNAGLLASRKVDATLTDLREVPVLQHFQIRTESGCFKDLLVRRPLEGMTEDDVVSQRHVLDPRRLAHVSDSASQLSGASSLLHLPKQGGNKRTLLRKQPCR